MAQGEHAQRRIGPRRKVYEFLLAFKYSLLQGDGDMCRKNLLNVSMDKYDFVFAHVACCEDERENLEAFKRLHEKRLSLIGRKKLFSYLLFWLGNRRFFEENADFATFEQFAIRLMMDLCAMVK